MLIIPVSACITLAYNAERAFIPAVAIRFQNWGENRKQYSNAWKEKKKVCGGEAVLITAFENAVLIKDFVPNS